MQTERKQVLGVGDTIDELVPVVNAPTQPIGGTMHGDIKDLTYAGTGFEAPPLNTVRPVIVYDGLVVGDELTGNKGVWATQWPISAFTYEWLRDGAPIAGADNVSYTLVEDDVDASISLRVTATSLAGSTTATSQAIGPVEAAEGGA